MTVRGKADPLVETPWDARTYDRSSQPPQAWASEVLARLKGIARDATVLEANMVALARERLGDLTRATSIASAR